MCVLFHLIYLVLPLGLALGPIVLCAAGRWSFGIGWGGAYLLWCVLTRHSERDGKGRPWPAFENLHLWQRIFAWFPMKLIVAAPLPPGGQYIFGVHPHGGLAFNRGMFGFNTSKFWRVAYPGIDFRVLTATAAFRVPLIREMWLWSYCIDASKPVATRALRAGTSLLLYPGGEKEQLLTVRGRHRVFLNSRKGFIKLALQHGCSLVPVYVFGETDLYTHWGCALGLRTWIVKRLGAAIVLLSGSCGLLPHRTSLTSVSGPPIHVPRVADPTQRQIDELHVRYVRALLELFDSTKATHGYADARLEIL